MTDFKYKNTLKFVLSSDIDLNLAEECYSLGVSSVLDKEKQKNHGKGNFISLRLHINYFLNMPDMKGMHHMSIDNDKIDFSLLKHLIENQQNKHLCCMDARVISSVSEYTKIMHTCLCLFSFIYGNNINNVYPKLDRLKHHILFRCL